MSYKETAEKLSIYRGQIDELRKKMREARASIEPEGVSDYLFKRAGGGTVKLSELFGDKDTLFVIHNMGASCPYCTLWADGFNGIYDHLANRATFVLSSPDTPNTQKTFAASRGWRFPMVSHNGTTFAADMGYRTEDGGWLPGTSMFRRELNSILRVSDAGFNPSDDFCVLWHIFDLLPGGAGDWQAKYRYG